MVYTPNNGESNGKENGKRNGNRPQATNYTEGEDLRPWGYIAAENRALSEAPMP